MGSVAGVLRVFLLLLDVGRAQVLATGKPAGAEIDVKYAIIGTALGVAISAGFLALKLCMIRKHLFDNDSSDLRSTKLGYNDTVALKKKASRLNLNFSERDARVIEL
ncbi:transmembrane protein 273 [Rhinolophus ferrumequinum]|uniref:Transmembrane protein 273 n=1 Tax=Rhinolophus ferrumequinum TaxID=59479 RepID=A0A671G900_RHIFE|nr:transmembrane protein 273 isoform X2 [Rhinolophus ferrumequinum]KAF6318006.1 transmembrane protein 273 [Rhinolophus ferrumequinum]